MPYHTSFDAGRRVCEMGLLLPARASRHVPLMAEGLHLPVPLNGRSKACLSAYFFIVYQRQQKKRYSLRKKRLFGDNEILAFLTCTLRGIHRSNASVESSLRFRCSMVVLRSVWAKRKDISGHTRLPQAH